jgi:hypothetical protein
VDGLVDGAAEEDDAADVILLDLSAQLLELGALLIEKARVDADRDELTRLLFERHLLQLGVGPPQRRHRRQPLIRLDAGLEHRGAQAYGRRAVGEHVPARVPARLALLRVDRPHGHRREQQQCRQRTPQTPADFFNSHPTTVSQNSTQSAAPGASSSLRSGGAGAKA